MNRFAHFSNRLIRALLAFVVIAALTTPAALAQDDAELEANKELVRRLVEELFNQRNLDIIEELFAPGYTEHDREGVETFETIEAIQQSYAEYLETVPGLVVTIDDLVAEGDRVVTRFTATLQDGAISASGINISRIEDGKFVEDWEIFDELGLMTQLGLIPPMDEMATESITETIATGLNGPQGILIDEEGNIWVVDAGIGGETEVPFLDPESGQETTALLGDSSRILMIAPDGSQTEVAALPSVLVNEEASGGSRLALLDGVLYATSGGWFEGIADERLPGHAAIVAVDEEGVTEVANTWDIENEENPDGFVLEAHPYGLTAGPDGMLWVADAGANALLQVDPASGEVAVVTVFDGIPGPLPNAFRGDAMEVDPVPTAVIFDDAGNAYVSLLSGFPFPPGAAKVVMVDADGEVSDYATGLTMLTDLRVGPDGEIYAVQIAEFGEQGPVPNSGAIVHVHEGEESEVVFAGLSFPTSLDFDAEGNGYVTINGVGAPGSGEVVRIAGLASGHEMEEAESEYAPIPEAAMGPAIPQDKGYVVEEIATVYWVGDGAYQMMFLTTGEGVIVVDAPPSMGPRILDAIAEVTDEPITHVIYSHAHADHIGAAAIYPEDAVYIAQEETAAHLADTGAGIGDTLREIPYGVFTGGGPVPLPTETFADSYTLEVGDQVLELAYHGENHIEGNIFIYAPQQKVLMLVDIVFPGWSPFQQLAVSEDVQGYMAAHEQALAYDFDTFIGGHLTRSGTREDVEAQLAYMLDIEANAAQALQTVDFNAIAQEVGFGNIWVLFNSYLDAVAEECAALTVPAWVDVLGAVDVNTEGHCARVLESLRIN